MVPVPTVDLALTGANIVSLRKAAGLTVHDLQTAFGFNSPQAIYKWQNGAALPTVDKLYFIVIHIAAQFLLCLPSPFVGNALIFHNTSPLQQREYLFRLCRCVFSGLITKAGFLHMFHIQCLLYRLAGQFWDRPWAKV